MLKTSKEVEIKVAKKNTRAEQHGRQAERRTLRVKHNFFYSSVDSGAGSEMTGLDVFQALQGFSHNSSKKTHVAGI